MALQIQPFPTLFPLLMFINAFNLGGGETAVSWPSCQWWLAHMKAKEWIFNKPMHYWFPKEFLRNPRWLPDVYVYLCICSIFVIPLIKINTLIQMRLKKWDSIIDRCNKRFPVIHLSKSICSQKLLEFGCITSKHNTAQSTINWGRVIAHNR